MKNYKLLLIFIKRKKKFIKTMGKFIKKFNTHSEYESFIQTDEFVKPNVSICVQENDVHYNPWTWAEEYLTFVAKEDGTFSFTPQNSNVISYSTDNGTTWTEGNSVEVSNGDKVMWKGEMTPSTTYTSNWVNGVASSGTFVKNSAATWANTFGVNGIPNGWTVQTASI